MHPPATHARASATAEVDVVDASALTEIFAADPAGDLIAQVDL